MRRCTKCQSSMVLESTAVTNGWTESWGRVWKCIGCGREEPETAGQDEEPTDTRERESLADHGDNTRQ